MRSTSAATSCSRTSIPASWPTCPPAARRAWCNRASVSSKSSRRSRNTPSDTPTRKRAMRRIAIVFVLLLVAVVVQAAPPAWVAKSNEHANVLIDVMAQFSPETASGLGIATYDAKVVDLGPDLVARRKAALEKAKAELEKRAAAETDPLVRQDLDLMIDSANRQLDSVVMEDRFNLAYIDAPRIVFSGVQRLTDPQLPASRRANAIERLRAYAGLAPGTKPA